MLAKVGLESEVLQVHPDAGQLRGKVTLPYRLHAGHDSDIQPMTASRMDTFFLGPETPVMNL